MKIEIEREDNGRWIAEVPDLVGLWHMGRLVKRPSRKFNLLPYE